MRRAFYLLKRRYRAVLGEIPTYPVPTWPLAAEWIPTYPVLMYMMIPTRLDTQIQGPNRNLRDGGGVLFRYTRLAGEARCARALRHPGFAPIPSGGRHSLHLRAQGGLRGSSRPCSTFGQPWGTSQARKVILAASVLYQ